MALCFLLESGSAVVGFRDVAGWNELIFLSVSRCGSQTETMKGRNTGSRRRTLVVMSSPLLTLDWNE